MKTVEILLRQLESVVLHNTGIVYFFLCHTCTKLSMLSRQTDQRPSSHVIYTYIARADEISGVWGGHVRDMTGTIDTLSFTDVDNSGFT